MRGIKPSSATLSKFEAKVDSEVLILLDINMYPELLVQRITREVINRVQKLRKKAGLEITDVVSMQYHIIKDSIGLESALHTNSDMIRKALRGNLEQISTKEIALEEKILLEEEQKIQEAAILLRLLKI